MTNPDNIVRVRARNGGRASVLEANAWCQMLKTGLLEGNGVVQNTSADMNVLVGGSTAKPDVVIAENPAGYKIALDIVGQQAIAITAPASNSRISAIVAYTDDLSLASEDTTVTGSPSSCGLIVVNGSSSASPTAPSDSDIRSAITADGATGSQACYAIIATIEAAASTTTITDSLITINGATDKLWGAQNMDLTNIPHIISSGVIEVGSVNGGSGRDGIVAIPTQPNTQYNVLLSFSREVAYYSKCGATSLDYTNNSFKWAIWNDGSDVTGDIQLTYLVVKNP